MKIALVTASLSRRGAGVTAVVEALSGALTKIDGVEVRVFGLADPDWTERDKPVWRGAEAVGFSVVGPAALGYAPQMLAELLAWGPDIVHHHGLWTYPSHVTAVWAKRTGRPYVVSPHGMLAPWALQRSRWKKLIASKLFQSRHLANAAALHALASGERDGFVRAGLTGPAFIVPNGVTLPSHADKGKAAWTANIGPEHRVMLFLGRLHVKKNVEALLRAWSKLDHARDTWRLVIAGWDEGGHASHLQKISKELQLQTQVHFTGPLFGAAKDQALRGAAAFVLPSTGEALPVAVLEAWSYSLPVLMTDACNLTEAVGYGAARRLALSADGMVSDLNDFLRMTDGALAAMGTRGRQLVEEQFRWPQIARSFLVHYQSALT